MTPAELKATRTQLGWSQAKLGLFLGVSRNTITRWETNVHHVPGMAARLLKTLRPRKSSPRRVS